jgi:50S ribosomal subunit-associated GTPase HflX
MRTRIFFRLNSDSWGHLTNGDHETYFIWEILSKTGFLFSNIIGKTDLQDEDSRQKIKDLDRKFLYLSQSSPRDIETLSKHLELLLKAVINQLEIKLEYSGEKNWYGLLASFNLKMIFI